jgi:hypothetical protein
MIQEITIQESDGGFTFTAPSNHPVAKQIKIILICYRVAQELASEKHFSFSDQLEYWLKGLDLLALASLNKIVIRGGESERQIEIVAQAINDIGELAI